MTRSYGTRSSAPAPVVMGGGEVRLIKPGTDFAEIRPRLRSFDMLAIRGASKFSDGISHVEEIVSGAGTGRYTHCALVVWGDAFPPSSRYWTPPGNNNALYIFESTMSGPTSRGGNGVYSVDGDAFLGVQLRSLDAVLAADDTPREAAIAWCSLRPAARRRLRPELWGETFRRYNGIRYDASPLDLCAAAFPCLRPWRQCCLGSCCRCCKGWLFCSELVANVYKDLGVLDPGVEAQNVLPSDYFARPDDPTLSNDRDGEIPLLFEPPVPVTVFGAPAGIRYY